MKKTIAILMVLLFVAFGFTSVLIASSVTASESSQGSALHSSGTSIGTCADSPPSPRGPGSGGGQGGGGFDPGP